jgi:hypothetical protein
MSDLLEQDSASVQRSFAAYEDFTREINDSHPQHQGLSEIELRHALANPSVIKTSVEVAGETVDLPQLSPVNEFEWLYTPFYEKHFPEQMGEGTLLHYTDFKGVEPGQAVKDKLTEMADKGGVLVFDYPDSEAETPSRILEQLEALGIEHEEVEMLGDQTYFGGEIGLKREHESRDKPTFFVDTFNRLQEEGKIDPEAFTNGTVLQSVVDGEDADNLSRFYAEAYETISDCPCTQSLSPDEFREMLADPKIAKIVYRNEGVAETMCLVTQDIEGLDWVNSDYYKKLYSQKAETGELIWFPGIATDPDPSKAGHNAPKIINLLASLSEEGDFAPVVVYDLPPLNNGFLDVVLDSYINSTPETGIAFQTLGAQKYGAVKLSRA